MNCKEHILPELELATGQVREALQCILHTILFIRSPGSVVPYDVECDGFDLTYTRIASDSNASQHHISPSNSHNINQSTSFTSRMHSNVEKKVDDAIESFLRSLSQIGPELMSGRLILSFFERRASKQLFGLVSHEERVIWEQWILRVVVNNTPRPITNDSAAVIERQRIQDTAEGMLRAVMQKIFELTAGGGVEHVPPVIYEFEIRNSKCRPEDDRETVYARVANMPTLIQLGN
eukprot:CAMPEP_0178926828 /NCGR_PEP_ID=MMETSP0786-20121207/18775_1 /TAXON_ID=186022 /ORGANISM="Thalassionema frauenfeldii, Strain CCMP 1798" /LENGTH=234 /DNA_ID=CAMNT_0020602045 /DNA_START=40 /DNA_END=744 /DNA_ORIENTATION=+